MAQTGADYVLVDREFFVFMETDWVTSRSYLTLWEWEQVDVIRVHAGILRSRWCVCGLQAAASHQPHKALNVKLLESSSLCRCFLVSSLWAAALLYHNTQRATGTLWQIHNWTRTSHKSRPDCSWRRYCCHNNVQTCAGSRRLRLTNTPQIITLFFLLSWTPPRALCLPPAPSLHPALWWEASSFIQVPLCLSFSSSEPVLHCEWVCISDIIHPLTSHSCQR